MKTQSFAPDDPVCPMNYPGFVYRELRRRGYKSETLLRGTTLTEEHFQDPNARVEFATLRRFVLNAIEATGDVHLGPRLAQCFETNYIGPPAYAAMNAPRFVDGLRVLDRFSHLTFPAIEFDFPIEAGVSTSGDAEICVRAKFPFDDIVYFVTSSALLVLTSLMKDMLRTPLVGSRCEVAMSEPDGWAEISHEITRVPVRFDAPVNRIIFSADLLDRPLPGADAINHHRLVTLCERYSQEALCFDTPVHRVISYLEINNNINSSLSEAAAALGYSERGLRRHLERSGASFRKLVEQTLERRARDMLADSSKPIHLIAHELGYETPSNFARSFKRWTGKTPRAYRDERRATPKAGQK